MITLFGNLPMYANDREKITARGAMEVFQRSAGIAARDGKSALAAAHGTALRNTTINAAGRIGERLHDVRWLEVPNDAQRPSWYVRRCVRPFGNAARAGICRG